MKANNLCRELIHLLPAESQPRKAAHIFMVVFFLRSVSGRMFFCRNRLRTASGHSLINTALVAFVKNTLRADHVCPSVCPEESAPILLQQWVPMGS
jgi:hypothetical protein